MSEYCAYFRGVNASVITKVVEKAMELQRDFPDIMAGFDLVRSSDCYYLLTGYRYCNKSLLCSLPLFLHRWVVRTVADHCGISKMLCPCQSRKE